MGKKGGRIRWLGSLKKRRENKVIDQLEGKMAGELGEWSIGDLKRREKEVGLGSLKKKAGE